MIATITKSTPSTTAGTINLRMVVALIAAEE
jgi:hypothetical protein